MVTRVKSFQALGRHVARAQDAWLRANPGAAAAARERLLAFDHERPVVPRASSWRRWALLLAAATVVVLGILLWPLAGKPLAFDVGPSEGEIASPSTAPTPGAVGEWIAAPPQAALPLRFSDGSVIVLDADARARVAEVTAHGARVVVERGAAQVRVVHRQETHWDIKAGPFDVRVVGTAFEVGWDPTRDVFTLSLKQGEVAVRGCALPRERVVAAGETFRAVCRAGRLASTPVPTEIGSTPAVGASAAGNQGTPYPAPSSASTESDASSPAPAQTSAGTMDARLPSKWQRLVASGRNSEAVDEAQAEGLSAVCNRADVASLMGLGDAARFAGRADTAAIILRRLRERFPDDERASIAAFDLGRIAFDASAYDEALRWFGAYLRERPTGPLAREASGRVIETLERSGDHTRAREAARRYLRDFPNGPHADFARSIGGL